MTIKPVEGWADVRDLRMRYLDWGGDGMPVLALHGLASSAHWYDIVAPMLTRSLSHHCPRPARPRADNAGDQRLRLAVGRV